jgi:hypothetical protein
MVLNLDAANAKSYPKSGTVWNDLSGNRNNGTLTNGPTFSSDNGGNIAFDGIDDYVNTFSAAGLTTFTISFWARTTETRSNPTTWQRRAFIGKSNSGDASGDFGITVDGGYLGYWSGLGTNDTSYLSSLLISDNSWRNIVVTNTGSSTVMYVNGSIITASILISGKQLNSEQFWIGGKGGSEAPGSYCVCSIANLLFYAFAISDNQIQQNYNAQKSRFGL